MNERVALSELSFEPDAGVECDASEALVHIGRVIWAGILCEALETIATPAYAAQPPRDQDPSSPLGSEGQIWLEKPDSGLDP